MTLGEGKRKSVYKAFMRSEECSIEKGTNVFYCNDVKEYMDREKGEKNTCTCHLAYHIKYH